MLTFIHTGMLLDSDAEPTPRSLALRQQWITIAAGCAAAALAAWLLAPVSLLVQPSPFVILLSSCLFVAVPCAAGFLGLWIADFTLPTEPHRDARHIFLQSLTAWMLFPCIAMLYQRQSPLVLLPAAIAAIITTIRVRSLFTRDTVLLTSPLQQSARPLNSFYGLPKSDSGPALSALNAICAVGVLVCMFNQLLFSAVLLLTLSVALPFWQWSIFAPKTVGRISGTRSLFITTVLALIFTIFAVAPEFLVNGFWPFMGHAQHSLYAAHATGNHKGIDRDYISIVLLPPPAKRNRIVPPSPDSGPGSAASKSVVIPFDGSYWYFQPPAVGPGAQPHIVHGKPTAADIRSNSIHPLAMEAHQKLDIPIDLSCCRAIDLAITNADTRPGPIALRMALQDSNTGQMLNLGKLTVPSSAITPIHLNRQPVHDTLHFVIPSSSAVHRFDRITVIYLPDAARARVGAKVSIESFTLVPR